VKSARYYKTDNPVSPYLVVSLSNVSILFGVFIYSALLNVFMLNLFGFFCGRISFDSITMGFLDFYPNDPLYSILFGCMFEFASCPKSSGGKSFFLFFLTFYDFLITETSSLSSYPNPYNFPPVILSYSEFFLSFLLPEEFFIDDYRFFSFDFYSIAYEFILLFF
jgi:hypothetical protein